MQVKDHCNIFNSMSLGKLRKRLRLCRCFWIKKRCQLALHQDGANLLKSCVQIATARKKTDYKEVPIADTSNEI